MDYKVIRSKRKTISIAVNEDGVTVRAPYYASKSEIDDIVEKHRVWIRNRLKKIEERKEINENTEALSKEELKTLYEKAAKVIPERTAYFAEKIGVTYGRITIRCQKTRWGSCSSSGNLNFNCLLMLTPPQVLDSVVVHELCHRKEMNHSRRFYAEVYKVFPEYDKWNKWLKENGASIMARVYRQ